MKKLLLSITALVLLLFCAIAETDAQTAPEVVNKAFDVSPGGWLTLNSELGTIDVKTTNRNRVNIVYTKSAKAALDKLTQKAFADFDVTFRRVGADVHIEGKFKKGWEYWMKRLHLLKLHLLNIRFEVSVPRQYNVDLNTSGGISVSDLVGEVRAQTYSGDIQLGSIARAVEAETTSGSITLKGCKDKVAVQSYSGDVQLGNVAGTLKAETTSGDVRAGDVNSAVTLQSYSGDVQLGNVVGTLKAETTSGSITLKGCRDKVEVQSYSGNVQLGNVAGTLKAETTSGDIRVGDVDSAVVAQAYSGDVQLGDIAGAMKVETTSGDIRVGDVGGGVVVQAYSGDVQLGDIAGAVEVETTSGSIILRGGQSKVDMETYGGYILAEMTKQSRHQWTLETSGGEIVTRLFSRVTLDVDAQSSSGRVSSDFPVQGSKSKNSLKGTINGGGPLLKLRTSSGDIRLQRK